ncbi:MAG: hypothetical protein MI747_14155 [Desulfobacterales bacterium]|nr:hypothetical protein [Desulfobacterales bacterium]
MKQLATLKSIFIHALIIISLALVSTGCIESLNTSPSGKSSSTTANMGSPNATPKTTALYYDFEDVLVPRELKVVQDRTVVISTPGYTSGILVLKGNVERSSLINFFINNMQKDNWGIVSQIKSPDNSILVFDKASKCAVISIKVNQFNTYVEVGVAPKVNTTATALPTQQDTSFSTAPQTFSQGTLIE